MWIKCSDMLPPMKFDGISQHVSEDVLITNGKYIEIGCRETFLSYEDGEGMDNWCWWVRSNCLLNEKDITHWMPLPGLPKECEFSCGNCKHFYYCEIAQGGSCWGEANVVKKRNADDKICELFISNK